MAVTASAQPRAPRRLARHQRRKQLVAAALPIVARHGFGDFSLDAIAERAGVTRNLLYHYFPRGRPDIVLAVVERAGQQLTSGSVIDEARARSEPLAADFARILDHALAPTHAWRIHRMARATFDPEVRALVMRFVDVVISSIALKHLDGPSPPPLVILALEGFVSYTETVLEAARTDRLPREQVSRLLSETLSATIGAALRAS